MRPVKFRLRLHNKIVGYEKWYEGKFREEVGWEGFPRWLYSVDGVTWTPTAIFHDSKDQFIGFLDKSGKDIYEGDIVTADWHWISPHEIKLPEDFYDFTEYFCNDSSVIEVIGNIWENPELVGVKP